MLKKYISIIFIICEVSFASMAQIEKVFVETYYIADSDDASFEVNGKLKVGAKTYRIYVDLAKGSSLMKMYGDNNHALIIASTDDIYNNVDDGATLGYDINRNRLKESTVAIDSWLTLGQIAKSGTDVQFGIPKAQDQNGASTVIGIGDNIDYLLKNEDTLLGIPLTIADGLMPSQNKPTNWLSQGFVDPLTNEDVTVFGNVVVGKKFETREAFIRNNGTQGVIPDSNQILVAQITTAGELMFELNLEVLTADGKTVKYVANAATLLNDEVLAPLLKYPPVCGCQDPNFLEFNTSFACSDQSKCKTPIVIGCMDPQACNYNSSANFNVESLCCYIGYCNDNDLEVVCPNLPPRSSDDNGYLAVYPNPVTYELNITHDLVYDDVSSIEIYNSLGQMILKEKLSAYNQSISNVVSLLPGSYTLQISNKEKSLRKNFIKLN